MSAVLIENPGCVEYVNAQGNICRANFPLLIIRAAWRKGTSFEDLADGFGKGRGTMGGDWSGIRDSSGEAIAKMFDRACRDLGIW